MAYDPSHWGSSGKTKLGVAPAETAQKYIDVKFKSNFVQIAKDTKYDISDVRVNEEIYLTFHIELSTADNPTFSLFDSNDTLIVEFNLINSGNTNTVTGTGNIIKLPNGYVVNFYYTYIKNGTPYYENQNGFITTRPTKLSFGADNGYDYISNSYVKITQK